MPQRPWVIAHRAALLSEAMFYFLLAMSVHSLAWLSMDYKNAVVAAAAAGAAVWAIGQAAKSLR